MQIFMMFYILTKSKFNVKHMRRIFLLVVNTISFIGVLFLNYLFGSGAGGRKSVGEISVQYDTLITPAGYAFSIWGLIYLLLTGFVVYQWYSYFKGDHNKSLEPTGIWFAMSNVLNGLWIFVWTEELLLLSVAVIFLLLISLLILGRRLHLSSNTSAPYFFVQLPIAVYLGWIIVASVVNASVWFYAQELFMRYEVLVTIIILIIATIIYLFLSFRYRLFIPSWVGVWAFLAIYFRVGQEVTIIGYSLMFLVLTLTIFNLVALKNKI